MEQHAIWIGASSDLKPVTAVQLTRSTIGSFAALRHKVAKHKATATRCGLEEPKTRGFHEVMPNDFWI